MVFCPSCGSENEVSANFCINCSLSLNNVVKMTRNNSYGERNFLSKNMKIRIILFAFLITILSFSIPFLIPYFYDISSVSLIFIVNPLNNIVMLTNLVLFYLLFRQTHNELKWQKKMFSTFQYDLVGFSKFISVYIVIWNVFALTGFFFLQFFFQ